MTTHSLPRLAGPFMSPTEPGAKEFPNLVHLQASDRPADKLEAGELGQAVLQDDASLEPGERRPDTHMDATAEGDVAADVAVELDLVGVRVLPFVTVRRSIDQRHPRTLRNGDAVQDDLLPRNAG